MLPKGERTWADTQDFGWQSKGDDHFRLWFPFFPCLLGDKSVLFRYCLVLRPFCIFLIFSSDFWPRTLFLFCFLPFSLIGNFPFRFFSDSFDREFSLFLLFFFFFIFSFYLCIPFWDLEPSSHLICTIFLENYGRWQQRHFSSPLHLLLSSYLPFTLHSFLNGSTSTSMSCCCCCRCSLS